jgi:hypothetical protein
MPERRVVVGWGDWIKRRDTVKKPRFVVDFRSG